MKATAEKTALRRLPQVEKLLGSDAAAALISRHSRPFLVSALRKSLEMLRNDIKAQPESFADVSDEDIAKRVFERAQIYLRPDLRRVINATGVMVHTNLGRAPLAEESIAAMNEAARGYSNLEYDLEAGARGSRQALIEAKLCELTGAKAALVVNNNAGAVLLALMTIAAGREAIVSRGELVEIGGSFRIPDVMAASGAKMVEVGTTNKTHLKDYEKATGDETAMLLKVHRSNFFIGGFTKEVPVPELAALAHRKKLALMVDLGSGALVDTAAFGLPHETMPRETLKQGADVVTFSGDKLLGGPQAGIIVGRKDILARLKSHPAHRALRPDKLTLAALEATLRLYIQGKEKDIPVIAMLSASPAELKRRAVALKNKLQKGIDNPLYVFGIEESYAKVGGGALADAQMPSFAVSIQSDDRPPKWIMERLRGAEPPVIARIERDRVLLDMRTLIGVSNKELADAIFSALKQRE